MHSSLTYRLRKDLRELTPSEIERLVCEYAQSEGIIAYEMNFYDFKEVGINTYKKASVLAKFAKATVYIPTDVIAQYFRRTNYPLFVGINGYGAWDVTSSVNEKHVMASGKTIEYALTSLVLKIERVLHDNRPAHSIRSV